MNLDLWALLTLLSKFSLYASVASAIGGVFSLMLLPWHPQAAKRIPRYTGYGCIVGIVVTVFSLLLQVGAMGNRGFEGAFDFNMIFLILSTSVGHAVLLAMTGFLLIGGSTWWSLHRTASSQPTYSTLLNVLGCLVLIASFSQIGHFSEASWVGKLAISLHILAVSIWVVLLYPLWIVSRTSKVPAVQISMETFGRIAFLVVGILVICGITMGILLVKDFHTLVSTAYGRGLLLKLVLVAVLLLLAARNKWLIVPHLNRDGLVQRLSRAIQLEIVLVGVIFLVTAAISVVIGINAEGS